MSVGIKGKSKTEDTYRAVNLDSSSSVKDFYEDRKKYYRKYILNEEIREQDVQAITMGRLVETLLLEPHLFDEKFYMSSCISEPTGLMMTFIDKLYTLYIEALNDLGELTTDFDELLKEAYELSGYKISYETVIKQFTSPSKAGDIPQHYFDEILKVRLNNLTVVGTQDVTNAERIVDELRNNFVTSGIINLVDSAKFTVLNQYQVEAYNITGEEAENAEITEHMFKSMIDKVIIDHTNKTISIYDLKCTWSVEGFYEDYYLKRKAYIQGYMYWHAMNSLTSIGAPYDGYTVENIRFIVCDSTNYMNPLIYKMSNQDMQDAELGFEYKGRTYRGVIDIIKDLRWAIKENIWNISRENYESDGIVNLTK